MGRLFAFVAILILTSPASAETQWTTPGWYQIAVSVIDDAWFVGGPFESEDACKATLPAAEEAVDYECQHLEAKPAWAS